MRKAKRTALCVLVCFAVLFSCALPALAEGMETGTTVSFIAEEFRISSQTEDFALKVGEGETLQVTVEGIAPFTYEWKVSTDGGTSWAPAQDAVSAPEYEIRNARPNKDVDGNDIPYWYSVTVTNSGLDRISAVIKVLVSNDYEYKEATDGDSSADTPPTVSGYIHDATELHVDPIQPESDLSSAVWAAMSARIGSGETYIEPYNIYFTNGNGETVMYHGELEVKFDVGTAYNGTTVKIVHYHTPTGAAETLTGTVVNGSVAVTVHDLCPFMAVVPNSTVHVITASAGTGGGISPSGNVNVGHGGGMYFYFIPNNSYVVDKVYIDNIETSVTGDSYHFTNVTAAHTIRVTFKTATTPPPPGTYHTIAASAGAHGRISPEGNVQVADGGSQTFSFVPDTDYEVDVVTVDGTAAPATGDSYTFTNVTQDHTVNVTFKRIQTPPPTYYTIAASAGAHGGISPVGNVQVAAGGSQTFVFLPDRGYAVDTVTVDGVAESAAGSSYRFANVAGDHTIHVTFTRAYAPPPPPVYYTVTAGSGSHGRISPSGSVFIPAGGSQTFYFIPDEGYEVDTVTVDGVREPVLSDAYLFVNLAGDHTIRVTFKPVSAARDDVTYHTITAGAGENGSVSPEGSVKVVEGNSAWFYFIPDDGFEVDAVVVDGAPAYTEDGSYCFENVTADHSIEATFKKTAEEPKPTEFHTVAVSFEGNGSVSPAGDVMVAHGGAQTFYFIAGEGFEVGNILLNGEKLDEGTTQYTVENITDDMTLFASFVPVEAPALAEKDERRCLWESVFGACAICSRLGRSASPWCVIAPSLVVLGAAGIVWYLLRKRK